MKISAWNCEQKKKQRRPYSGHQYGCSWVYCGPDCQACEKTRNIQLNSWWSQEPIRTEVNFLRWLWELITNTSEVNKAREFRWIAICLSFTSAWWRRWRGFSRPITERIKARPMEYRKIYRDRYSLCISDADAPTFCPLIDPWVPCRPFVEHLIGYLRLWNSNSQKPLWNIWIIIQITSFYALSFVSNLFFCVFWYDCNTPTIYIVVSGLYGVAELNIYKQEKPKFSSTDETKRKWGLEYLQTGKNENFQRKVKTLIFVVKQQSKQFLEGNDQELHMWLLGNVNFYCV